MDVTYVSLWCDDMLSLLLDRNIVLRHNEPVEIATMVVPRGPHFEDNTIDYLLNNERVSAWELAHQDSILTKVNSYMGYEVLKNGALAQLSARIGPNFWVTADDDGILSLKYHLSSSSTNPEEEPCMRIAYARVRVNIRVHYFEDGVPDSLRLSDFHE